MSPSKLGLLTLVSGAVAIPHYGYHSKFHNPSGGYAHGTGNAPVPTNYPTGGYYNSTALPQPTNVDSYPDSPDDTTTTIVRTVYSTATLYSTIFGIHSNPAEGYEPEPTKVGAVDVPTGAGQCNSETIYVTATNKVTVTVTAGKASGVPTYAAPASSAPEEAYSVYEPVVIPSSSEKKVIATPAPSSVAASSSKAAAPTLIPDASDNTKKELVPSNGYAGTKRGLAYNDPGLCKAFSGGNIGFAYNWASVEFNPSGENIPLPEGIQFIPMMHGPTKATVDQWKNDVDKAVQKGSTAVMGFNEPDHGAQANLSPQAACEHWKTYMQPLTESHPDLTIIGPSVTNGPPPMGLDWLDKFNQACPDATWHATNIHFYDIYDGAFERFKAQIKKAAEMFGKPVWVTEFGLNPGSASDDQAAEFLQKCIEHMDADESVQGYSWFMVGTGQYQLNTDSGLSKLGQVYAG